MMLLDTHALVWWVAEPARIPKKVLRKLDDAVAARQPVSASSISIWEIAMLVERKRLELRIPLADWLDALESLPFLSFVPVDNRIAARAVALEGFPHRDPADRMIVATALGLGATLITADARLRAYQAIPSLWA
jgi:PIN domain nuclease of toxin-antitoxin system